MFGDGDISAQHAKFMMNDMGRDCSAISVDQTSLFTLNVDVLTVIKREFDSVYQEMMNSG